MCPVPPTELMAHSQQVKVQEVQIQLKQLSFYRTSSKMSTQWWCLFLLETWRRLMSNTSSPCPHNKLIPTGKGVGTSPLTVTEGRRGPAHSSPSTLTSVRYRSQMATNNSLQWLFKMVEPKERGLHRSRYHPYATVAPQGGSAELTPQTGP